MLLGKGRHEGAGLSFGDPLSPICRRRGLFGHVQVRHHGGPMLGIVADSATGLVKFLAHFGNGRLDMALRAIALEHGLTIGQGQLLIRAAIHTGLVSNRSHKPARAAYPVPPKWALTLSYVRPVNSIYKNNQTNG